MISRILNFCPLVFLILILLFAPYKIYAEEEEAVLNQLEILQNDIKTLEKAVYSQNFETTTSGENSSGAGDDILTKHLLKLSELEEQFKILTNNFEEINFKLDKLSNRITKIQTDNQIRFQDIERSGLTKAEVVEKKLPGSSEPQDLGAVSDTEVASIEQVQETQSIESVGSVVTETAERTEKLLPEGSPEEQYKFAISFLKVGDYETAEFALKEFVDKNSKHNIAGSAQYW